MPNKIKIIADSTCDISEELKARYDITMMPTLVFLGDNQFKDGVDIDPDALYKYVEETSELPRTSAANTQYFLDFWKPFLDDGYDIIHFHIGSEMSGTYNAACLTAKDITGNKIYPIDSGNLSSGIALLAIVAGDMVKENKDIEEIVRVLNETVPKVRSSFIVDSIEYLYKGGRCSGIAALGANLLKLKPCIEVADGKMSPGKKYRGKIQDIFASYVNSKLEGKENLRLDHIFITHSGISQEIVDIVRENVVKCQNFKEIHVCRAGATISTHCGPGTLGILFIDDSQ